MVEHEKDDKERATLPGDHRPAHLEQKLEALPPSPGVYLFRPAVSGLDPADVSYAAIRFYADGGCRLLTADAPGVTAAQSATAYTIPPLNESFFTVVESRQAESTLAPNNFFCVQIDSYTGKTRVYRP